MCGQNCRMVRSVWQIPQATSRTRISSARGSSSSTSSTVKGRPPGCAMAALTMMANAIEGDDGCRTRADRTRPPVCGRGAGRAGEWPDHRCDLPLHPGPIGRAALAACTGVVGAGRCQRQWSETTAGASVVVYVMALRLPEDGARIERAEVVHFG